MYSQRDLSTELGRLLGEFPGVVDHAGIADWAYKAYLRHVGDIEPDVKQLLMQLGTMSMVPEFELSEAELRSIVESNS